MGRGWPWSRMGCQNPSRVRQESVWLLDAEQGIKASGGVGVRPSSRLLGERRFFFLNRVLVVLELGLEALGRSIRRRVPMCVAVAGGDRRLVTCEGN